MSTSSSRDGAAMEGHAPIDREKQIERAVLVQVELPERDPPLEDALSELTGLTESAGADVVGTLTQKRRMLHIATCLGRGRVDDLVAMCQETEATLVVVGHDLTPAQGRNLEEAVKLRVVDRSQLIMDLFASRAQTHEARLQVELAQLRYSLPRLRRLWTHLDRYKGGVGMRGPGETQIESDRREIRRKILDRERRLATQERHHERQRAARSGRFTVGLLGYTSAGKSTLFNTLTGADVLEEDRPFSTLDTRTKTWRVSKGCSVLLSDTIGFVRDLPHHLIASFHATLAEALEADLLLHVVDGSREDAASLVRAVEDVLERIGADDRPRLLVVNKVDAVADRTLLGGLGVGAHHVSARTREGLDLLGAAVAQARDREYVSVRLELPHRHGDLLARIEAEGTVDALKADDRGLAIEARLPPALAGRLRAFMVPPPQAAEEARRPRRAAPSNEPIPPGDD